MRSYLDFEKPVADLQGKVQELRSLGDERRCRRDRRGDRPARGQGRAGACRDLRQADAVAEDAGRAPSATARISATTSSELIEEFTPLAGDRKFAEDAAIVAGLGRFRGRRIAVIGHEKGSDTESRLQAQFRHGAAGGLSQGGADDGTRRPLRPAGGLRWSTPPAPIPASAPRSAARPRRSPARPRPASSSACPTSRWSSARAARAARSRSPPPTRC